MNFKVGQRVWDSYNKCFVTIVDIKISEINIPYSWEIKDDNGIIYRVDLFQIKYIHQTADDMFKELWYEDCEKQDNNMIYKSKRFTISFGLENKEYWHDNDTSITVEEHLAIHQKLIELGWIE